MHAIWGLGMLEPDEVRSSSSTSTSTCTTTSRCSSTPAPTSTRSATSSSPRARLDHLDHAPERQFFGGKLGIDATAKWPEEGARAVAGGDRDEPTRSRTLRRPSAGPSTARRRSPPDARRAGCRHSSGRFAAALTCRTVSGGTDEGSLPGRCSLAEASACDASPMEPTWSRAATQSHALRRRRLWPVGFAIGHRRPPRRADHQPALISSIGAAIAIVFGFLWARDATRRARGEPARVEPERREPTAPAADRRRRPTARAGCRARDAVTRSRFLEGATLGLGAVIGGLITLPVARLRGPAGLPRARRSTRSTSARSRSSRVGEWFIATFIVDPAPGRGQPAHRLHPQQRRRRSETKKQVPSFTIISNHCVHLGCPVQPNGPIGDDPARRP